MPQARRATLHGRRPNTAVGAARRGAGGIACCARGPDGERCTVRIAWLASVLVLALTSCAYGITREESDDDGSFASEGGAGGAGGGAQSSSSSATSTVSSGSVASSVAASTGSGSPC